MYSALSHGTTKLKPARRDTPLVNVVGMKAFLYRGEGGLSEGRPFSSVQGRA